MSQTPQQDFLKSISSLLRVSPKRRELLLAELEDHLEFRRAELAAKGYSGDELDRASLSEFGDPGQLAAGLTAASHRQFRRQLMRYTLATSAGVAVSLLAGISMWHNARGDAPVAGGSTGSGSGSAFVAQNSPPAGGDGFSGIEDASAFPGGRFVPSEQAPSKSGWFELVQSQPRGNFGVPNSGAGAGIPGGGGRGGGGGPVGTGAPGRGAAPGVGGGAAAPGAAQPGQFPGAPPPGGANAGASHGVSGDGTSGGPGGDSTITWGFAPAAQGDSPEDQLVRARLNKPLGGISFEGVAFVDAMKTISDAVEVDIIVSESVRERFIRDAVIKSLTFKYSQPPALAILKSVIEDIDGDNRNLSIVVRDGVVRIVAASNAQNELRVYNCRDLLRSEAPAVAVGAGQQPQVPAGVSMNGLPTVDLDLAYPIRLDNIMIDGFGTFTLPASYLLRVSEQSDPNANAGLRDELTTGPNAGAAAGSNTGPNAGAAAGSNPPTNSGSGEGLGQPGSQNFPGAAEGSGYAPDVGSGGSSATGGGGEAGGGSGFEGGGGLAGGSGPGMSGGMTSGGGGFGSGGGMMMGGGGPGGIMMGGGGFGGGGGLGGGGFDPGPGASQFSARQQELLNTVKETIIDRMNQEVPPALQFFDGLLVVNGSAETHEKVSNLLRLLREASQQPVQQPAQIPGGLSPHVPVGGAVPGPGGGSGSVAY